MCGIRTNVTKAYELFILEVWEVPTSDSTYEALSEAFTHWKIPGFEVIHGMLDRVMKILEVPRISSTDFKADTGYYIKRPTIPLSSLAELQLYITALHQRNPR